MNGKNSADPVITLEHVSFSYGQYIVLDDVNLKIESGDFACIVGPNGGGKSTLLKLMLGLLNPNTGAVRILGDTPQRGRPRIGYVPQNCQCDLQFPVTVMDVVLMGRLDTSRGIAGYRRVDKDAALDALREVDLFDLRKRTIAALSGGQRQRVLIARALVANPRILLLDEPMANVDILREKELIMLLKDLSSRLTILLVTHDFGFVSQYVNRVVCVNRSVVVHATSEMTGEIINEMYGHSVRIIRHDHREENGALHA
jgi:zinc transport system ATP-binding protein